jgi:hypothetical protein
MGDTCTGRNFGKLKFKNLIKRDFMKVRNQKTLYNEGRRWRLGIFGLHNITLQKYLLT